MYDFTETHTPMVFDAFWIDGTRKPSSPGRLFITKKIRMSFGSKPRLTTERLGAFSGLFERAQEEIAQRGVRSQYCQLQSHSEGDTLLLLQRCCLQEAAQHFSALSSLKHHKYKYYHETRVLFIAAAFAP